MTNLSTLAAAQMAAKNGWLDQGVQNPDVGPPLTAMPGPAVNNAHAGPLAAPGPMPAAASAPAPTAPVNPLTAHVQRAVADPSLQARLQQAFGGAYVPPKPIADDGVSPLSSRGALKEEARLEKEGEGIRGTQKAAQLEFGQKVDAAGTALANVEAKRAKDEEASTLEGKSLENQVNQEAEARHAELLGENAKLRQMHSDPAKWYKDRGTAGTIAAAFAQAAGAFAAGMPHGSGKNTAGEIIQGAVDREIQSQDKDIDNAWKVHADKVGEDQREYAKGQHKIARQAEARIAIRDNAKYQGQQIMAGLQNDQAKAGITNTIAELDLANQKDKDGLVKQRLSVGQQEQAAAAASAHAAAAAAAKRDEWIRNKADEYFKSGKMVNKDTGMPDEVAAVRAATALHDNNPAIAGSTRIVEPGKVGAADKDKKVEGAVESYRNMGLKAAESATFAKTALNFLPRWLAPESNMAADDVRQYNQTVLPQILKGLEARMTPEQVKEQAANLEIHRDMSEAQKKARVQSAMDILGTGTALKTGKGTPADNASLDATPGF